MIARSRGVAWLEQKMTSTIVVTRNRDDVWAFLADLRNAPKWDRSIASATLVSGGPMGTDAIVETRSPQGKRQSFRVTAFEPPRVLTFRLQRSPLFRLADLTFSLGAADGGTRITHEVHVRVRVWFLILLPISQPARPPSARDGYGLPAQIVGGGTGSQEVFIELRDAIDSDGFAV